MDTRKRCRGRIRLTGLGMDGADGHVRLTRGRDYQLLNGSSQTHSKMQAKAEEFLRLLRNRGLSPDNISRRECMEVLREMGMRIESAAVPT